MEITGQARNRYRRIALDAVYDYLTRIDLCDTNGMYVSGNIAPKWVAVVYDHHFILWHHYCFSEHDECDKQDVHFCLP